MIRPAVDDMQIPATEFAVFGDDFFDKTALVEIKYTRIFRQTQSGCGRQLWIGRSKLSWPFNPATLIAGKPRTVSSPRQKVRKWIGHRSITGVLTQTTCCTGVSQQDNH
ncbi:MAG TPA: hypothetical protein VG122_10035 [Gemmata sp.]|jgi:hypothetical protein|nr:hypothetical protein [Gemmata sp.]